MGKQVHLQLKNHPDLIDLIKYTQRGQITAELIASLEDAEADFEAGRGMATTFMPVDFHIEEHTDGSKTVWLSDHDPMARMKGMHGVCLHPGKAYLELKVRAYNRCKICGRSRAYMRRFGMCRICFRENALKGLIPGVTKSSW